MADQVVNLSTPAILPTDIGFHKDDSPAEPEDSKAAERTPDDAKAGETGNPESVVNSQRLTGNTDRGDIRGLLNQFPPNAR